MQTNEPKCLFLLENHIDIWLLFLPTQYDLIDQMLPCLSDEEIYRINEYYFREDQIRFAVGRYHLKKLLGRYLAQKAENIVIGYQKYSKPFLEHKSHSHIKFNLSHSGEMLIYAFSLNHEVGVDIEKYDKKINVMGISKKYFSEEERKILYKAKKNSMFKLFYNIWTCKEAYLKYRGMGLGIPSSSFPIYPTEENLLALLLSYKETEYFHRKDKYFATLCTPYSNPCVAIHYFNY